jgi:hypothetical protein
MINTVLESVDESESRLQEVERAASRLKAEKLPKEARAEVVRIHRGVLKVLVALKRLQSLAPFSPEEAGERLVGELQAAEGGAFSGQELRKAFKLTPQVLHRRRKERRIIYWRDARHDFFYPRWQFTATGALLPGVQDVLQIFNSGDEWRVMSYFLGPRKQLNNRRPLDLLRAGEIAKVIAHARDHAAENTW